MKHKIRAEGSREVDGWKNYIRMQCIKLGSHLNRSFVTIRLRSSVTAISLLYHKMTATQFTCITAGEASETGVGRRVPWWWNMSSDKLCDFWMANRAQSPNQSVNAFSLYSKQMRHINTNCKDLKQIVMSGAEVVQKTVEIMFENFLLYFRNLKKIYLNSLLSQLSISP